MTVLRIERNRNYTVMSNHRLRDTGPSLKSKVIDARKAQSADIDPVELCDVRHKIRPEYERAVREKYSEILGEEPASNAVFNARYNTDKLLHEKDEERGVQQIVRQRKRENQKSCSEYSRKRSRDWER